MARSGAPVLMLMLVMLSACGAPPAPAQPSMEASHSTTLPSTVTSTATWPAFNCPDGFVQEGPSSCRDLRSPTPTPSCPPGSELVGHECQQSTPTPIPTPADSPTPLPTPDYRVCKNLNLPAQYWLMPLDRVQSFLDSLDGKCIIFAFDPELLKAAITFPGNVVLFENAYQARLLLDVWPSRYSVVWGIVSKPNDSSSMYRVHALQFLPLPVGEAPFSDGTYLVNANTGPAPGPWKTAPHRGTSNVGCYWQRVTPGGIVYSSHFGTASTATTLYNGEGFQTRGCTIWVHVGFSTTGNPIKFISAAELNDPCHNRYDNDGTCHSDDYTWAACLAAGKCYLKYK